MNISLIKSPTKTANEKIKQCDYMAKKACIVPEKSPQISSLESLTLRRKIPYRKMRDFLVYSGQDSNRRARRGSIRRRFRDKPGEKAAEPIPHSPQKNPLSKDEGFFKIQRTGFGPEGRRVVDQRELQGQAGGKGG